MNPQWPKSSTHQHQYWLNGENKELKTNSKLRKQFREIPKFGAKTNQGK